MRLYIALTLIWKPFNALHNPLRNDDNADMLATAGNILTAAFRR